MNRHSVHSHRFRTFHLTPPARLIIKLGSPRSRLTWPHSMLRHLMQAACLTGSLFLALTAVSLWRFGEATYGLNYLRGERLIAHSPTIDLGSLQAGLESTAEFRLRNLTADPIELYGLRPDCSCLMADGLPATIPPHGSLRLRLTRRAGTNESGPFVNHSELFLSVSQPNVILTVTGVVIPNTSRRMGL